MPQKLDDLTNRKFGRLTGRWPIGRDKHKHVIWLFSCDCGNLHTAARMNVVNGSTQSCGCLQSENAAQLNLTHGQARAGKHTKEYEIWKQARYRAKRENFPFDLEISDIVIPERCPLLSILLVPGKGKMLPSSPTIDKIIPSLGYVRGNVWIVSFKANSMKSNATLEEFERVARNWRKAYDTD